MPAWAATEADAVALALLPLDALVPVNITGMSDESCVDSRPE
jgi:hypothetical protein